MAMAALFTPCSCPAMAECRGDPSGGPAPRKSSWESHGQSKNMHPISGLVGSAISTLIFRFPPNFARQLSIKARRNCSNIGVAQVVAASAMNSAGQTSSGLVDSMSENGAFCKESSANVTIVPGVSKLPFVDGVSMSSPPEVISSELPLEEASFSFAISDGVSNGLPVEVPKASSSTLAVHAGERTSCNKVADSLTIPLVQTSTYTFKNTAQLIQFQEGKYASFEYGRYGNPTTHAAEEKLSALEGSETTLLMASGMCAATTMLLALVPAGGHIITTTDCYRRTRQFIQTVLPKMGIMATVIDPSDIQSLQHALDENNVSLFFSESPTNPYLRCIDIALVSEICHKKGVIVCIDGTFATPINQKALVLGADIVINSATKYIAGHNDVIAGSLSGHFHIVDVVRKMHHIMGGVLDPNAAYLILRGMKTLDLRIKQQNQTALKLAQALENHPKISRVHYPGLESHPEHEIAKRQMRGYGGVVSFEVAGDLETTSKFIDGLQIPYIAPSLGGCESLVEQPTIISYWDQSPEDRAKYGIKDNLVRFSCGIEDFEDIHADVMRSLDALRL